LVFHIFWFWGFGFSWLKIYFFWKFHEKDVKSEW
jgi:hypothetical protein